MSNLVNKGSYDFIDISGEIYREYLFPNGEVVRVEGVTDLAVSKTGHRLYDGKKSYYIPFGWLKLTWENEEGQPNFIK